MNTKTIFLINKQHTSLKVSPLYNRQKKLHAIQGTWQQQQGELEFS